jgi:hypothetical protein
MGNYMVYGKTIMQKVPFGKRVDITRERPMESVNGTRRMAHI